MGFNADATIIPGKGTVLVADPETLPPANVYGIDPLNPPPGWRTMGHTSRSNNVSMSKDGGESEQKGSWWTPALRNKYGETNWGFIVNSLQIDKLTLGMAFGGGTHNGVEGYYEVGGSTAPQDKAVILLVQDGPATMAWYTPRTTVAIGDAPSFDVEEFLEIQLAFSILDSQVTGKKFRVYHPALKDTVPTVVPTITSAGPETATTGTKVWITGDNFNGTTGATGVKFGSNNATSYEVLDNNTITAVMPSGTAGAANIVVTNAVGASTAFTYSRG